MSNAFTFTEIQEPHKIRRKEILAKYPQVKELFGYDPNTKYQVMVWILAQLIFAYLLRNQAWWLVFTWTYIFGGCAGTNLYLALHEISHDLLFEKHIYNQIFGIITNCVTIIPHFTLFTRYHRDHHQKQGDVIEDADLPSKFEGVYFRSIFMKLLWVLFQPLFYALRPLLTKPKSPNFTDIISFITSFIFDYYIYNYFGGKALFYLFFSGFFGSGLHPVAGHFIAEHYVTIKGQETYSYYGPLNLICYNVGYHNEHHDFPRIPGSRLPLLKKMAPEYYTMPHYESWMWVMYDYITNPNMNPYSRITRKLN